MATVYFHELVETVSNPYFDAWYFDGKCEWLEEEVYNCEIGDACNWNFGVDPTIVNWNTLVGGKRFLIQQNWQPGGLQCVLTSSKSGL